MVDKETLEKAKELSGNSPDQEVLFLDDFKKVVKKNTENYKNVLASKNLLLATFTVGENSYGIFAN